MPMYLGMTTLFAITGLVLFATYHKCDPFLAGRITKRDQVRDSVNQYSFIIIHLLSLYTIFGNSDTPQRRLSNRFEPSSHEFGLALSLGVW